MDETKKNKILSGTKKFLKKYKLEEIEGVKIGFMDKDDSIGKMEAIKTGVIPLDLATGGLYKGMINVWYGSKDSCKSTAVRDAMATIAQGDTYAGYMNQEKTLDRTYWENGGVNQGNVEFLEFITNEQALDYAISCASREVPLDLLAIDTVQALASEKEIHKKGSDAVKSVKDDNIALIPRVYSQFLRTYTSLSCGKLTLLLISQVRTTGIGSLRVFDDMTGGNAIKHYNVVTLRMERAAQSNWPDQAKVDGKLPPNSFPIRFTVDKIKALGRYSKIKLIGYFYKGKFDKKFNTIYIGKDIGVHDGKSFSYPDPKDPEKLIDLKYRGANEMFNKIPDKAVIYMESLLEPTFLKSIEA